MERVTSYSPSCKHVPQARVLLLGPVGSGKSSFISSVQSVFNGRVTNRAMVGCSTSTSFTKKVQEPSSLFNIITLKQQHVTLVWMVSWHETRKRMPFRDRVCLVCECKNASTSQSSQLGYLWKLTQVRKRGVTDPDLPQKRFGLYQVNDWAPLTRNELENSSWQNDKHLMSWNMADVYIYCVYIYLLDIALSITISESQQLALK